MHDVMSRALPVGTPTSNSTVASCRNGKTRSRSFPASSSSITSGSIWNPLLPSTKRSSPLLRLLDTGRCWVKLSAPYETSKNGAPKYDDVGRLAKALVKHAPERMMWASNWPHPSAPKDNIPDDADLLDLLLDWAPDEATRRKILVDNPAELYGFR